MALPDDAQQPQAPAGPLAQVPVEILLRITSFLPTTDLGNVRLTCRSLEQSLFHFFSHEFFRKKQFMVFSDSLQALIDISKHPAFSRVLKHVIIATDGLSAQTLAAIRNMSHRPEMGEGFYAQARLAEADQQHLLDSGGLKDMLAEAFRNLPNLDTVDIRDFNSSTRNRDGERARWTSYGSKTLASRISPLGDGLNVSGCDGHARFPDHIFSAVLAALAAADAHPSQIQVNLRSRTPPSREPWRVRDPWELSEQAFYIPPRLEAPLEPILAGLTTLHLDLAAQDPIYQRGKDNSRPFMLHRFLSLTPNLTWLRLNMATYSPLQAQERSVLPFESVFKWIFNESTQAQPRPSFPYQTQPIRFSKLERLDIGRVIMTERTLLRLVRKLAPSLKTLSLRRVMLLKPPKDADSDKATGWARLIRRMGALDGIDIRELNLSELVDGLSLHRRDRRERSQLGNFVSFASPEGSTGQTSDQRSFQGTSTSAIVAQILKDIVAPMPDEFRHEDHSDDISISSGSGSVSEESFSSEEEEEQEEEDQDDDDEAMDVD